MLEDAIKQISEIINVFPDIKEITITSKNHITIYWKNQERDAESFTNTIDLLGRCEENLK